MLRLRAPAKLNLYLRVLGRRPDGYHEIETLFERIDLADELTFHSHPGELRLTCDEPSLSCGEDNLVLKAARLLQQASGATQGVEIHLTKRIPVAAGLGGGSSDAAATLLGLNRLWQLGLSQDRLAELAARLGSDVAFFLLEGSFAIGTGRGERCEPLPEGPALTHVLVVPKERLSTKEVFASGDFGLTATKPSSTMIVHALRNGSLGELADGLWNDLQPEAIRRCPVIAVIQSTLRASGCLGTLVSGSGSSVFGLCRDHAQAQAIIARIRSAVPPGSFTEVIHTEQRRGASEGVCAARIGE